MADEEQTANELLFAALVRQQVFLLRLSDSLRRKLTRLLDLTEEDIVAKIHARLTSTGLDTVADVTRLENTLRVIRNIRLKAWREVNEQWVEEAVAIAQAEPPVLAGIVKTVSPVVLDLALPAASQMAAIAKSQPFHGRTLREWASSIQDEDLRRIDNAIRVGMIQGEGSAEIARRVVGSARLRGVDGVTEITRRAAQAITRTAVNHISNEAREAFIRENEDLFDEEVFVATLDSRTTPVCRANDGKRFPVGRGPRPPLHFNCRSIRVPALLPEAMGERPARNFTEQQLVREFSQRNGINGAKTRGDLPYGTKGAYDEFARRRVRELTGRVPAKTTYQEWLSGQSATFQDDILGKTKGKLFRNGGLKLDKFVNQNGDELTLSQLAKLHRQAFVDAGLDPEDFL